MAYIIAARTVVDDHEALVSRFLDPGKVLYIVSLQDWNMRGIHRHPDTNLDALVVSQHPKISLVLDDLPMFRSPMQITPLVTKAVGNGHDIFLVCKFVKEIGPALRSKCKIICAGIHNTDWRSICRHQRIGDSFDWITKEFGYLEYDRYENVYKYVPSKPSIKI